MLRLFGTNVWLFGIGGLAWRWLALRLCRLFFQFCVFAVAFRCASPRLVFFVCFTFVTLFVFRRCAVCFASLPLVWSLLLCALFLSLSPVLLGGPGSVCWTYGLVVSFRRVLCRVCASFILTGTFVGSREHCQEQDPSTKETVEAVGESSASLADGVSRGDHAENLCANRGTCG